MSIELSRDTFRRLNQLYLVFIMLTTLAVVTEMSIWSDFYEAADRLTIEYFGEASSLQFFLFGAIGFTGGVLHLVAAFGLLNFRPWSRQLLWLSFIPMLALGLIPGFEVMWLGAWSMWLEVALSALLGALLLLAYARDFGEKWFRKEATSQS